MRYRKLSPTGDYTFGQGLLNFYIDVPEAVGQAALTRLQLGLGEWFLDISDGTDWDGSVLGHNTTATRDLVIQDRVLGTTGLLDIASYAGSFNSSSRDYNVKLTVNTQYGVATIAAAL